MKRILVVSFLFVALLVNVTHAREEMETEKDNVIQEKLHEEDNLVATYTRITYRDEENNDTNEHYVILAAPTVSTCAQCLGTMYYSGSSERYVNMRSINCDLGHNTATQYCFTNAADRYKADVYTCSSCGNKDYLNNRYLYTIEFHDVYIR